MTVPLKDQKPHDVELALEAAFLGLSGRTVKVNIEELQWDEATSSMKLRLVAWDKLSTDPFVGAI